MTDRLILENAFGVPGGHAQGRGEGGQRSPSCGPLHGEETPPRSWAQGGGRSPSPEGEGAEPQGWGQSFSFQICLRKSHCVGQGGVQKPPPERGGEVFLPKFSSENRSFPFQNCFKKFSQRYFLYSVNLFHVMTHN